MFVKLLKEFIVLLPKQIGLFDLLMKLLLNVPDGTHEFFYFLFIVIFIVLSLKDFDGSLQIFNLDSTIKKWFTL